MIDETHCDAVMIGRGVLGNPWLIKECVDYLEKGIEPSIITPEEKLDMILHHLELLKSSKNEKVAILEMRSHAAWYLKGIKNTKELKEQIFKITSIDDFKNVIEEFKRERYYE